MMDTYEIKSTAKQFAASGLSGIKGDPLPYNISYTAWHWINGHLPGFRRMIRHYQQYPQEPITPKSNRPGG